MNRKQTLKAINAHRGPIYVEVSNFNDTFWIQAVKTSVIDTLKGFKDNEETGFILDADGYFGKDYLSQH